MCMSACTSASKKTYCLVRYPRSEHSWLSNSEQRPRAFQMRKITSTWRSQDRATFQTTRHLRASCVRPAASPPAVPPPSMPSRSIRPRISVISSAAPALAIHDAARMHPKADQSIFLHRAKCVAPHTHRARCAYLHLAAGIIHRQHRTMCHSPTRTL